MALITCYECGKEISNKATSCPNCGAPQQVQSQKISIIKRSFLSLGNDFKPLSKFKSLFWKNKNTFTRSILLMSIPCFIFVGIRFQQANGNISAFVWRFFNEDFINTRCSSDGIWTRRAPGVTPRRCRSLLYKLGKQSEDITLVIHKYCKNYVGHPWSSVNPYEKCVVRWKSNDQKRRENLARSNNYSCPPGKRLYQNRAFFGLIKGKNLCLTDYEAQSLKLQQQRNFEESLRNAQKQYAPTPLPQSSQPTMCFKSFNASPSGFGGLSGTSTENCF